VPAFAQEAPRSPTPKDSPLPGRQVDVARGLEHPWGLAFLPDGRMLVTERPGRLRLVSKSGELSPPLAGVPQVYARGQGGLLDVALSPTFAQDQLVYLSFAEPGGPGGSTAVARGRLGERGLEGTRVIWRQEPKVASNFLILAWRGIAVSSRPCGPSAVSAFWFRRLTSTAMRPLRRKSGGTLPSGSYATSLKP